MPARPSIRSRILAVLTESDPRFNQLRWELRDGRELPLDWEGMRAVLTRHGDVLVVERV